ncbi:hypothetical protein PCARR_a1431 [Pseudoalteromonas carrageenovora IAM 12662]|uniref:Uncharacterized protein n=1 Tax=Pseudoalteromonas carrageenovora IAM 12662 TaxID=1314868 RepID=A0ABR9ERN1_PSEVC|nr:hypothetical protein [Pseudoalteromonas carrageenovora IAM 12662]
MQPGIRRQEYLLLFLSDHAITINLDLQAQNFAIYQFSPI